MSTDWTREAVAERANADKAAWAAEQDRRAARLPYQPSKHVDWRNLMDLGTSVDTSRLDPRDPDPSRSGIFRDHNCSYCRNGELPCRQGAPNRCDNPIARNH